MNTPRFDQAERSGSLACNAYPVQPAAPTRLDTLQKLIETDLWMIMDVHNYYLYHRRLSMYPLS